MKTAALAALGVAAATAVWLTQRRSTARRPTARRPRPAPDRRQDDAPGSEPSAAPVGDGVDEAMRMQDA